MPWIRARLCLLLFFPGILCHPAHLVAQCVPFREARNHVGSTKCVSGTVLRVEEGEKGVTFLDFCEDYRVCPFTVVVFASDLKHVGDVRTLKGRPIEVHGHITDYDGRAEIILKRPKQLGKDAALVPPLPKEYDVERKGHYSAGKYSAPKSPAKTKRKQQPRVDIEDGVE
jgi:hypothetical protein